MPSAREVAGRHERDFGHRNVAGFRRPALDAERRPARRAAERQAGDAADRLHAGQRGDALEHAPVEQHPRLVREVRAGLRIVRLRQPEPRGQHRRGVEAEIDALQPPETLDQQRRADQQHQRERELADDEDAAQARRASGGAGPARRLAHHRLQLGVRALNRRRQAEEHAGHDRQGGREREHGRVDVDGLQSRQARRADLHEGVDAPDRDQQAERAAGRREQHALGQELPHQARAAGAQRAANGNLPLPDRRAREQQVRDVGAGDQQHEADRGEQRQQRRTHVADQIVVQRMTRSAQPAPAG